MADELKIARWYVSKSSTSEKRGIEFDLGLLSFRNIALAKKCYYTGLPLNDNTRTIDRIDSNIGYIKGNVVACHKHFNQLKGMVEDPNNSLSLEKMVKGINKWRDTNGG